jgi:hypothetical protein
MFALVRGERSVSPATQQLDRGVAVSRQTEYMRGASLFPQTWPLTMLQEYLVDAFQRGVIFLDVLRQRGNVQRAISNRPMATVLRYEYEIILSGPSLPRPINYYLARIQPPPGVVIKPGAAPIIVIDPRAGQGPGIGGFKLQSEIGEALAEGHPVYFVGFSAQPEPGQTFLDVVDGQVAFVERVGQLHPDGPRPVAFGNCQAGYQTLMAAMLRPKLFGTVIMAGSPLSYWQGVRGKNPVRYEGGLLGGSWLTALTSDLGDGQVDGAYFIENFDNLNPANFLWGKQYHLYANIDTEPPRYLGFEKWWGDFVQLNGVEIQYLVDQLFIGDKLTRNELTSNDGHVFDARNVTAPVVCFASRGDNISPPPQALGWILDLYRDAEEIRARGRTIAYCLDPTAGHLAIFVSSKVAAKEDAAFIRTLDMLDVLPPGLYELIVTPKTPGEPCAELIEGEFLARFEPRTLEDIRALGRNSEEDDRAFATVKRLSELNLSLYRTFAQPLVRLVVNKPVAQLMRELNPLRLSYTIFADDNPAMAPVAGLAEQVRTRRQPVAQNNPLWQMQETVSTLIEQALDAWRDIRDSTAEAWFFTFFGSPLTQGMLGTGSDAVRQLPAITQTDAAAYEAARAQARTKLKEGGVEEAIVRALLFVLQGEGQFDERVAAAFRELHMRRVHLSHERLKQIVRDQAAVLQLDSQQGIDNLIALLPEPNGTRAELLELVSEVASATGPPDAKTEARLDQIAAVLSLKQGTRTSDSWHLQQRLGCTTESEVEHDNGNGAATCPPGNEPDDRSVNGW